MGILKALAIARSALVLAGCDDDSGPFLSDLAAAVEMSVPNDFAVPSPCANHIKDGDETDVDCGGSCGPCAVGKSCLQSKDCDTMRCVGGQCAPGPTADLAAMD